MLLNFSWVIEGALCGLAMPGRARPLARDLDDLAGRGVTLVVTALSSPMPAEALESAGLAGHHVAVRDFAPPTQDQLERFVARARDEIDERGGAVAVHCFAGMGRTGTLLAAYLVAATEVDGRSAIDRIRRLRPGSIETVEQEQAVLELAARLRRRARE